MKTWLLRSTLDPPSSLIILSQARDVDRLGNPFISLMPRVRDHVVKYANEILSVMRRYGGAIQ
ncbi:hypothetical protein [Vulcanisaeta distributa]|uniref:hypothetical protein n=1 Tax=Vulcanisaeta distributa TaxID=164451 RepID=UPI000AB1B6D8|nr:hypothetical protein [Vulcanisaeta distributa]